MFFPPALKAAAMIQDWHPRALEPILPPEQDSLIPGHKQASTYTLSGSRGQAVLLDFKVLSGLGTLWSYTQSVKYFIFYLYIVHTCVCRYMVLDYT